MGDAEYVEPTMCYNEKHTTDFANKTLPEMKAMVANAKPGTVEDVAKGWKKVHDKLVGPEGIKAAFEAAVDHALQHWEGKAADAFAARAKKISAKLTHSASYAENVSIAMTGTASALSLYKQKIDEMEMPSKLSSAGDFIGDGGDRSDEGLRSDLKNNVSTEDALGKHRDSLSAGKERQLEAAIVMEQLGAAYNSQARAMGSWRRPPIDPQPEDYPGEPGGVPPVAAVVPISPAVSRPKPSSVSAGGGAGSGATIAPSKPVAPPRDSAVVGGAQKPVPAAKPQVGTVIDGISGGIGGGSVGGGAAGGAGGSGTGGTVGGGIAGGGAAGVVGGARGVGGVGGRGAAGVGGAAGRGTAGGGAAGRGGAAGAGRPGMPGAAGAAPGGRAGAASGRAGSLARQKGGVVGGAPGAGGTARGTAGGSGLHRSRGAAQAAGGAGRPGGPMGAGVPRGRSDRAREENRREGERPDYLVEDEETWATQRNTAPRVVE